MCILDFYFLGEKKTILIIMTAIACAYTLEVCGLVTDRLYFVCVLDLNTKERDSRVETTVVVCCSLTLYF